MKLKNRTISLRISDEAANAYGYLQSIRINPSELLRSGGENAIISKAKEMKQPIKSEHIPF
jgi:hypothetical protein